MPLINRVTRLFQSDMHAVLDRIEEPDIMLRQAVREMEEDVMRNEQRLKLTRHEQARSASNRDDLEHSLEQLDGELDICFGSGKDDLARSLVKRKLETSRLLKMIERKQQELISDSEELETRLEENRSRLAVMKQKLEILSETEPASQQTDYYRDEYPCHETAVTSEDIEVAFLREKQKRAAS